MIRRLLSLVLLFLLSSLLSAQVALPFEEEAPESLLEFEISDSEVSLFLLGSWNATSRLSGSWIIPAGDDVAPARALFPGLRPAVPLQNEVNLTLSLWLLSRYFFETTVTDELESSTILFGYIGMPGELVESVLIGNTAIGMGAYPYLGFGDADGTIGIDAPGASLSMITERSYHEMMIRLASASRERIVYTATGVVTDTPIDAGDYIQNRYFVLPDGGLDFIQVYEQSNAGSFTGSDGARYRRLLPGEEFSFSLAEGTLWFDEPRERKILVYYEVGGLSVGAAGLGVDAYFGLSDGVPDESLLRDFSFAGPQLDAYLATISPAPAADELGPEDVRVVVDADAALVIHEPGRYSPFEQANRYSLSGGFDSLEIRDRAGAPVDNSLRSIKEPFDNVVALEGPNTDPREFSLRYPLAGSFVSRPAPQLYGRDPRTESDLVLVSRFTEPTDSVTLPATAIPGSVTVLRNGSVEPGVTLLDSGEIELARALAPGDQLEITYREQNAAGTTDLVFGAGNRFYPFSGLELIGALGMRWSPGNNTFSYEPNEYPGYLVASVGAAFDSSMLDEPPTGDVSAQVTAAIAASTTDTTGALRVGGMNEREERIAFSPYLLVPASPPAVDPDDGDGFGVTAAERGRLLYKHFYEQDLLGNASLLPYTSTSEQVVDVPYEAGGRSGPYPALSIDSSYAGTVAVMEYELPTNADWVGAQLNLGVHRDYSDIARLSVPYNLMEESHPVTVYLQIGALSEDLDDDGLLDTGTAGLPFTDSRSGFELLAGTQGDPDAFYTEDINVNGVPDAELPERVLTREITPSGAGWQTASFELTRAEQSRLAQTRAVRVLIVRTQGDPQDGKLLLGDITLRGAPYELKSVGTTGSEEARVYSEPSAGLSEPTLAAVYPEVGTRLENETDGGRHLRMTWSSLAAGELIVRFPTAVPAQAYSSLRLYVRDIDDTAPLLTVRALENESVIAETTFSPTASTWNEAVVPLPEATTATVTRIELSVRGSTAGSIAIDEVSFWDPRNSIGAVVNASVEWKPDVVLQAGSLTLLSDLMIRQAVAAHGTGFPTGLGATLPGLASSSGLSARILDGAASIDLDLVSRPAGTGGRIGHRLERPLFNGLFTMSDSYERGFGLLSGFTHAALLSLTSPAPLVPSLEAAWNVASQDNAQVTWSLSSGIGNDSLSGSLTVGLVEQRPAETYSDHLSGWMGSFSDLIPREAVFVREVSTEGAVQRTAEPFAFELDGEAHIQESESSGRRDIALGYGLTLPVPLGEQLLLELILARSGSWGETAALSDTPWSLTGTAVETVGAHPYALAYAPFYELFAPDYHEQFLAWSAGLRYGGYTPSVGALFSRGIESSAWSLIIPTSMEVSIARPAERDQDAVSTAHEAEVTARFIAPNLFGRLGTTPLLRFYDTDEFQSKISAILLRTGSGVWSTQFEVEQQSQFFWSDGRELEVDTTARLTAGDQISNDLSSIISYRWKTAYTQSAVEFLPTDGSLLHTERLELGANGDGLGVQLVSALFRHTTSATLGESGTLSLDAGLGLARSYAPVAYWIVGAELAVEVAISF